MRDIAGAFRLYVKEMPEQGPCLRAEINHSFRDSKTLSEKIKEIVKGDDDADKTPDGFIRDRSNERNKHEDDNEDGAKQD
jgi:hypothetical protein